ncbi:hypothetical protein BJX61DRAFT_335188 [Aspergillus egyptiacus]|nr:hypothetical protein BJX61DRAFT_335188 [Aspergillus egyptiacus]
MEEVLIGDIVPPAGTNQVTGLGCAWGFQTLVTPRNCSCCRFHGMKDDDLPLISEARGHQQVGYPPTSERILATERTCTSQQASTTAMEKVDNEPMVGRLAVGARMIAGIWASDSPASSGWRRLFCTYCIHTLGHNHPGAVVCMVFIRNKLSARQNYPSAQIIDD